LSRWTRPLSRAARREIENRSPVPLASPVRSGLFGYQPSSDMLAYLHTYGTDGVIHPIVSRLAESVSEAEWKLWYEASSGDDQDRKPVKAHAVLDLLDHPNDFQPFSEIVESGQQHVDLVGECSIVLGFAAGLPSEMWVLRPDRIQPVPDAYNFLKGWVYTAPGDGEKIPLEPKELLRIRQPSPVDPYRGMGAVQALLRDLDAQRFTKEWQANFFKNSAVPGGMLKVDRRLGDEEFDELSTRWAQSHQGVGKAHRVAILEQSEWVQNAFSLKDLQIAELDGVGRDKALAAFGMPKSIIGIVEDVNRANAEAGEYLFARWMLKPRLNRWKSMLNRNVLKLYPSARRMVLDYADPVPENSEQALAELTAKGDVVVKLVGAGFDAAEVLELVDWPDLSYEAPPPPTLVAPPGDEPGEPGKHEPQGAGEGADPQGVDNSVDNAMRWVVRGHRDDSCCDPCRKNLGKLYRNRSDAYADYPGGAGYIKCVGAQYGNKCRCKVLKRRSDRG
jgi:HK97 family phage portal protein